MRPQPTTTNTLYFVGPISLNGDMWYRDRYTMKEVSVECGTNYYFSYAK